MFMLSNNFFNEVQSQFFFGQSFLLFTFHVCLYYAALFVQCSLVVTCWERTDLLALLCVTFSCFVTFPCGVPGQVMYLIASIPDLCLFLYFKIENKEIFVDIFGVTSKLVYIMAISKDNCFRAFMMF